mmetsp:Transcript_68756/g.128273  ORF Transcript_68756/g.128273 Transcript_68756/m.128273 type:complete len:543 (+) Transcript_68756:87-1715(+)
MGTGASAGVCAYVDTASQTELAELLHVLPEPLKAKLNTAISTASTVAVGIDLPEGLQTMVSLHRTHQFDTSRLVPQKAIADILEAVRSLPTSANTQPWTVIVVQGATRDVLAKKLLENFDAGTEGKMRYAAAPAKMTERLEKAAQTHKKEYYATHLGIKDGDKKSFCSKYRANFEFWGAPLHIVLCAPVGPCLLEEPPVDGVFLDMGSLMTAICLGAHDQGLGVCPQFDLSKYEEVYRDTLGKEVLPEDLFVLCGVSIGYPAQGRNPKREIEFSPSRLDVSETSRWASCDSSWLSAKSDSATLGKHGLLQLIKSRHGSHSLDTTKPVPKDYISSILSAARYVYSFENTQPWHVTVIQGEARDKLSKAMLAHFDAGNDGTQTYKKYSAHNTAQMQKGKDIYGAELYEVRYGLQRDDKDGRRLKYRPNYEFWGAPVLLLLNLPKCAVAGTFVDVGSYMYAILLGMHAYGLGGKPLGSVAKYTDICRKVLGNEAMPDDEHLVCGICIGWPSGGRDPRETPDWFPTRLTVEETTRWVVDADWSSKS